MIKNILAIIFLAIIVLTGTVVAQEVQNNDDSRDMMLDDLYFSGPDIMSRSYAIRGSGDSQVFVGLGQWSRRQ